jgi:hypothetical protein
MHRRRADWVAEPPATRSVRRTPEAKGRRTVESRWWWPAIVGGAGGCGRAGGGENGAAMGRADGAGGGCGGPERAGGVCFICSIISLAEYPITVFASPCGA